MKYGEDYYERGVELGISGYTDYRWIPELTIPMCESIRDTLPLVDSDEILDFGCAKGFVVKGFRSLGLSAYGVDISEYAINNVHGDVRDACRHYENSIDEAFGQKVFDVTISKDVFEHVQYDMIDAVLLDIRKHTRKIFCVIPLGMDGKYIIPDYEDDVTHVIREPLEWWNNKLTKAGFVLDFSNYSFPGVKDNWSSWKKGNGFIYAT